MGLSRDRDDGRGISTTLDVTLALVLLTAAIVTLAGIVPPDPTPNEGDAADETASVVAGTTATVDYSLSPGAHRADGDLVTFPITEGPEFDRTAHGTLATLIADATVGNARIGETELTHVGDSFERAVGNVTAEAVAAPDTDAQVRATWRPYPGAPVGGRFVVGDRPPGDAAVHAATLSVPSGMDGVRGRAIAAADDGGYRGVATVLANATIRGLYPPQAFALALRGDYPVSAFSKYRYRRGAVLLGVDLDGSLAVANADRANRRLAAALADRFERDLRTSYATPSAAARNASVDRVAITVRTWSG